MVTGFHLSIRGPMLTFLEPGRINRRDGMPFLLRAEMGVSESNVGPGMCEHACDKGVSVGVVEGKV